MHTQTQWPSSLACFCFLLSSQVPLKFLCILTLPEARPQHDQIWGSFPLAPTSVWGVTEGPVGLGCLGWLSKYKQAGSSRRGSALSPPPAHRRLTWSNLDHLQNQEEERAEVG